MGDSRQLFLTGILYAFGRTLTYVALAIVLVASVLSVPQISLFLQKYMHLALGPLLIIVGMFLLGLIEQSVGKAYNVLGKVEWWARMGTGIIFILVGIFFALKYVFQVL